MSLKRISRAQLSRSVWTCGPACVLLLGLGGAVGCSAYPTFKEVPINCSVEAEYEFDTNNPVALDAWCSGDTTPDASATASAAELTNGDSPCGSTSALVFRATHNNDWGSTCGFNNFGKYDDSTKLTSPRDESAYDGLSFWARAPGNTNKDFTISFYDANATAYDPNSTPGGHCKIYSVDGGTEGATIVTMLDPSTGQTISGAATATRLPDECGNNRGNGYDDIVMVTSEWAFYTLPWGQFTQWPYPNRVPNSILTDIGPVPGTGLLTAKLYNLGLRPPKEVSFELWLDNVRFYRKKVQTPDAGQR
jgi:hypothetical protein